MRFSEISDVLFSSHSPKHVISYSSWGDLEIISIEESGSLLEPGMDPAVSTTNNCCRVLAMLWSNSLDPRVGTPLAKMTRMWRQVVKEVGLTCWVTRRVCKFVRISSRAISVSFLESCL